MPANNDSKNLDKLSQVVADARRNMQEREKNLPRKGPQDVSARVRPLWT